LDKLGLRHDRVRYRPRRHVLIATLLLFSCSSIPPEGGDDVPSGIQPWGSLDTTGNPKDLPGEGDAWSVPSDQTAAPEIAPPEPGCFQEHDGPDFLPFFSKSCPDKQLCPCNPTDLGELLAYYMGKATQTLDVCVMELQDFTVSDAVIAARKRGVAVRLILDDGYSDPAKEKAVKYLDDAGVEYRDDLTPQALMHAKFTLIDDDLVLVSSANYSTFDALSNANNLLVLRSPALVKAFRSKFDTMWKKKIFHESGDGTVHTATVDGATVQVIFGPDWAIVERLEEAIAGAKHAIHFSIFAFTLEDVKDAILDRCGKVEILGVYDQEQANDSNSVAKSGWCAGAQVLPEQVTSDFGYSKLHHKVLIVDPGTPDAWVIAGSANWSFAAATKNDEIMIATNHPEIVAAFESEFQARFNEAK